MPGMGSADALTIIVAIVAVLALALVGWLVDARAARGGQPGGSASKRWRLVATSLVVVGAASAAIVAPIISVFWVLVALNFALGRPENIPFSTYSMFAHPAERSWSLRVEDAAGDLIPIAPLGLDPVAARKRFAADAQAAQADGVTGLQEARRLAAESFARDLEEHRPVRGPLAATTIKISLVEYVLDGRDVRTVRTPLVETTPS
jgi:hypothetical protein